MRHAVAILMLVAGAAAGGCETREPARLGADFGEAVSGNAARQIIDAEPAAARLGAPNMDGRRAAAAIERYATGAVIEPEAVDTTRAIGTERQ